MTDKLIKEITEIETRITSATGDELADLKARLEVLQSQLSARSDGGEDTDSLFDNMPV